MPRLDYLLIGHIAHDETPEGAILGGTVAYAGAAAQALGAQVAILTSGRVDDPVWGQFPLGIETHCIPAAESTIFVNDYTGDTRRQRLIGRAEVLSAEHLPAEWKTARIVHLAPLADELDPALCERFPAAILAATPQGWMRGWDAAGTVRAKAWAAAEHWLPYLNVVILSEDDIGRDSALEAHYAGLARLLIVTRAAAGCTIYQRGRPSLSLAAPSVIAVDATGAGDIFAGVFLTVLERSGDAALAGQWAVFLASQSVTRRGIASVPTATEIARAERDYPLL
ncbi:MAG TPA: PfkB family carbohydrate kinase [Aggregatilineales bacterium]|nr:hypothetical protein [Anaerolineales bacterium]HRE47023.1 PfkB family carbohydrate kinase [Aggregatilineales bacterium]